jgi:two-component system, OmpR family, aerobic respiration control sensor histidine kinase ArcB
MTRAPDLTDRPDLADIETLQSSLQSVLTHMQQMDLAAVDAALGRRLTSLAQACVALQIQLRRHSPTAPVPADLVDHHTFDHLMVLAGPETAPDLLDRLAEDLQSVQQQLTLPRAPADWENLRAQSHILIGLAGAVGAESLRSSAVDLNNLANVHQQTGLDTVMRRVLPLLDALIRFVHAQRISVVAAQ